MALEQQVQSALASLPSPSTGPMRIDESSTGQQFECDLSAIDSLGCSFERFTLHSDRLRAAGMDEVQRVAGELSKRLTYLLEPIQPIETDSQQCVVQMRSVPPAKDGDRTSYYELLARKTGELSLVRYNADYGAGRQVALAHVTREVFLRLVRDFSAAAQ
ncbi:MAG TPA: hypothetical protein VHZ24_14235 [Pirellulales bacterium]|jgi:hypothetical protein|nr:hypothetical protein [Pirellulales bacterium]